VPSLVCFFFSACTDEITGHKVGFFFKKKNIFSLSLLCSRRATISLFLQVAINKITRVFQDLIDVQRIVGEIQLLRHFNHKNVHMLDI
jgi:hypothetical protein